MIASPLTANEHSFLLVGALDRTFALPITFVRRVARIAWGVYAAQSLIERVPDFKSALQLHIRAVNVHVIKELLQRRAQRPQF